MMAHGAASANRTSTSLVRPVGGGQCVEKCQQVGEAHIPMRELGTYGDDAGMHIIPSE